MPTERELSPSEGAALMLRIILPADLKGTVPAILNARSAGNAKSAEQMKRFLADRVKPELRVYVDRL